MRAVGSNGDLPLSNPVKGAILLSKALAVWLMSVEFLSSCCQAAVAGAASARL